MFQSLEALISRETALHLPFFWQEPKLFIVFQLRESILRDILSFLLISIKFLTHFTFHLECYADLKILKYVEYVCRYMSSQFQGSFRVRCGSFCFWFLDIFNSLRLLKLLKKSFLIQDCGSNTNTCKESSILAS